MFIKYLIVHHLKCENCCGLGLFLWNYADPDRLTNQGCEINIGVILTYVDVSTVLSTALTPENPFHHKKGQKRHDLSARIETGAELLS